MSAGYRVLPTGEEEEEEGGEAPSDAFVVRVKTLTGEHRLSVDRDIRVKKLYRQVLEECFSQDECRGKRLRLIYSGKVLEEDLTLGAYCRAVDGQLPKEMVVHAPLSEVQVAAHEPRNVFDGSGQGDLEAGTPRGFDRLALTTQYTADDVALIRNTFYQDVIDYAETRPEREGEDERQRMYRMEEEWISRQSADSDFARNVSSAGSREAGHLRAQRATFNRRLAEWLQGPLAMGNRRTGRRSPNQNNRGSNADEDSDGGEFNDEEDLERAGRNGGRAPAPNPQDGRRKHIEFLFGFSLGFILGVIMLCFIWDDNVSKYYRAGVMSGVICNMSVSPEHHSSVKASKKKDEKAAGGGMESEFEGFSTVIQ